MKEGYKIRAIFTFEIMGRPPEHIKKALSELIDRFNNLKGIFVENKNIYEPKKIEGKEELYTTFAETEILAREFGDLFPIIFETLPSHVEIIDPVDLKMSNSDLSSILSSLMIKIHQYDEVAKGLNIERMILKKKLEELEEKNKDKPEKETDTIEKSFEEKTEETKEKKIKSKKSSKKKN